MRLFIRKVLQKLGYDIVKYHPTYITGKFDERNIEAEFVWLKEYKFRTILDIGANEGQFADKIRVLFPEATIYSFEPLPDSFRLLQNNFRNYPNVIGVNLALGDVKGEIIFNRNENTASSSFLEMDETHKKNFDFAINTDPIKVKVDALDNVMREHSVKNPILIKIDVQGFEDKVIKGGMETLKKATMVICEVSFTQLYTGQLLFSDIYEIFKDMGFRYCGSIEQLRSPETNQILQADAVFIKM